MPDESECQTMTVKPQAWISPEEYLKGEKSGVVNHEYIESGS